VVPTNKIDVVIPYHSKDSDILEMCISGCVSNIYNLGNIYIVTKTKDLNFANFSNIYLINENELFTDGLSKRYIESRLHAECPGLVRRAGWLFQQLIKMGCSYAIAGLTEHYLVVDADVVFLKKIDFFREGRILVAKSDEFFRPYFDCYEKLLGESPDDRYSFVAHHMLISKTIMLELLDGLGKKFGKKWYDVIIENAHCGGGLVFSEYETYGHYLANRYQQSFLLRRLRNVQSFKIRYLLLILFNLADYVTFHDYKKPQNNPKTDPVKYKLFIGLVKYKLRKQKTKCV
jgi:hypothetical protein